MFFKKKNLRKLIFKESKEEFLEMINRDFPIVLDNHEKLIEIVHIKYPILSKEETTLVVKTFIEVLREKLITGCSITIYELFFNLGFYYRKLSGVAKESSNNPNREVFSVKSYMPKEIENYEREE